MSGKSCSGWVIVVAGGTGVRVGGELPKQFLEIAGVSLIERALSAVMASNPAGIVVPVASGWERHTETVLGFIRRQDVELVVVPGGSTRHESVALALESVPDGTPWVMVHDAARPFVSPCLIRRLFDALERDSSAIPGVPVPHTLKRVDERGMVLQTVDRAQVMEIQTPQLFRADLLRRAHRQATISGFVGTDCASVIEHLGEPVVVVPGDSWNLKITTARDIVVAEAIEKTVTMSERGS